MIEEYYYNDNVKSKKYYLNDKYHREDGPAHIGYYRNGNIKFEAYYINGKLHKEDGPALIDYRINGKIKNKIYYINNEILTYEHDQYKHNLSKQIIEKEDNINKLMIMRIVCKEKNNKELLDLVESKIIAFELSE